MYGDFLDLLSSIIAHASKCGRHSSNLFDPVLLRPSKTKRMFPSPLVWTRDSVHTNSFLNIQFICFHLYRPLADGVDQLQTAVSTLHINIPKSCSII